MRDISHIIKEVLPQLESLEQDRLVYRSKHRTFILIGGIPLVLVVVGGFLSGLFIVAIPVGIVWLIIAGFLYHFNAGKLGTAYRNNYKSFVLPPLIQAVDPGLKYDHHLGIASSSFQNSELYTTRPDRYSTEDLVHGNYGKTYLQLAEIDAEEKRTRTDKDGNRKTYYVTIFKGILLIADFHKHFHGRTFIFPDKAEKTFGNFGRFFQKMGGRQGTGLLRMEDPEFEKAFAVYSTDEIEARYILSTAMMRRLLDMRNRFGKDVRVGFKDSCLMLAVPHSQPFLEPSKTIPATDTAQIEDLLFHLRYFLDTIEELDLNTRIWTKE